MALRSKLLGGDPKLESCAISDPAHITPGSVGDHVSKIQQALIAIDGLSIDAGELGSKRYGPSTAAAVLAFKRKRNIIRNQTQVDNIVGILTIKALDSEMFAKEQITPPAPGPLPPLPPPPEPLSNQFAVRAAGRSGVFIITEKTDGDPTTVITLEVPTCYQVFDLINNRRALYSFARPGRGNVPEELLPPTAFARTPRRLSTGQALPLSGLACECGYTTRVSATAGPGPSRLELRLASGRVSVPMIIHLGDAFPISGPDIETTTNGNFVFRKFGFDPANDS
jgi:hypothetical protein